jgi:putative cell wall-binding protein
VLGGSGVISDSVAESLRRMTTSGGLQRVGGADRYATAADLAGYYAAGAPVAYVASGAGFPDALAGAALAGRDRVPVVLTRKDTLPSDTAEALDRLDPAGIVVLGGPGAVSDTVVKALAPYAGSGGVTRLAGADRYATAAAIAHEFASAGHVYVATGVDFPDALAGAARAGGSGVPMLLTAPTSLPASTKNEITRLSPARAYLLGGEAIVGTAVASAIAGLIG